MYLSSIGYFAKLNAMFMSLHCNVSTQYWLLPKHVRRVAQFQHLFSLVRRDDLPHLIFHDVQLQFLMHDRYSEIW